MNIMERLYKKHMELNMLVDRDDPTYLLADVFSEEIKENVSRFKNLSESEIKRFTESEINRFDYTARKFDEKLGKVYDRLENTVQHVTQKNLEKAYNELSDILNAIKKVVFGYLICSILIMIGTAFIVSTLLASKAKAATLSLKTTSYPSVSTMGTEASLGGSLMAAKFDINKSTSDDLLHGKAYLKLFPQAPINFTANYEEAKNENLNGKGFGLDVELKSSTFQSKIGVETTKIGTGFDTETFSVYDISLKKAISQNILLEPTFSYANESSGKALQSFDLNSQYRWSNKFDTFQSIGFSCGDVCNSPWKGSLGVQYTPSKNMQFSLASKTEPYTAFSPLPVKLTNFNSKRLTTHQLKFSTLL